MNTEIENHNTKAYFGKFGGQYVPETAMYALTELEKEYQKAKNDPAFGEDPRLCIMLKTSVLTTDKIFT